MIEISFITVSFRREREMAFQGRQMSMAIAVGGSDTHTRTLARTQTDGQAAEEVADGSPVGLPIANQHLALISASEMYLNEHLSRSPPSLHFAGARARVCIRHIILDGRSRERETSQRQKGKTE